MNQLAIYIYINWLYIYIYIYIVLEKEPYNFIDGKPNRLELQKQDVKKHFPSTPKTDYIESVCNL